MTSTDREDQIATVSRSRDKALVDIKKLASLAERLRSKIQHKAVKCWFITKAEPTADQRDVANKHHGIVNALTFAQFQSKLINAPSLIPADNTTVSRGLSLVSGGTGELRFEWKRRV